MSTRLSILLISMFLALANLPAEAQIRIEKPAGEKIGIHLAGLDVGTDAVTTEFIQALRINLERSGWFRVVGAGQAEIAVSGRVQSRGNNLRVECRVVGTQNRQTYISQSYSHAANDARRLAQRITDDIVEKVTGRPGIATSRIVMVGRTDRHRELFMVDPDGSNLTQLTSDRNTSVRPRFGSNPRQLTYTGYLQGFPDVYLVDLESGDRRAISRSSGLNTGGQISPNGQEVALILSKDGNPELYVMQLGSGRLTRLTNTPQANEASPSWSPDGREIVYVSDQTGRPQLYIISRTGGAPRRITTRGSENVSPGWGENGLIAYTTRIGRQYQVAIMDPRSGEVRNISDPAGGDFEDPSWAPNGRHIAVAQRRNFRSQIYIIDTAGDPPVRLTPARGDWYTPAWSPK